MEKLPNVFWMPTSHGWQLAEGTHCYCPGENNWITEISKYSAKSYLDSQRLSKYKKSLKIESSHVSKQAIGKDLTEAQKILNSSDHLS